MTSALPFLAISSMTRTFNRMSIGRQKYASRRLGATALTSGTLDAWFVDHIPASMIEQADRMNRSGTCSKASTCSMAGIRRRGNT